MTYACCSAAGTGACRIAVDRGLFRAGCRCGRRRVAVGIKPGVGWSGQQPERPADAVPAAERDRAAPAGGRRDCGNLRNWRQSFRSGRPSTCRFPTIMKVTLPVAVTLPDPVGTTGLRQPAGLRPGRVQGVRGVAGPSESRWCSRRPTRMYWGCRRGRPVRRPRSCTQGSRIWWSAPSSRIPFPLNSTSHRPASNVLAITPTLTYNLPRGWFVGYSDFDWTFDWEANGDATVPLRPAGRPGLRYRQAAASVCRSKRVTTSPARTTSSVPRWMIGIEFTLLFPQD